MSGQHRTRKLYHGARHPEVGVNDVCHIQAHRKKDGRQSDRHKKNVQLYARFIASLVKKESLLPFDKAAVARIIDYASRFAGDTERLTIHVRSITKSNEELQPRAINQECNMLCCCRD